MCDGSPSAGWREVAYEMHVAPGTADVTDTGEEVRI